jgi:hypothetical protein
VRENVAVILLRVGLTFGDAGERLPSEESVGHRRFENLYSSAIL